MIRTKGDRRFELFAYIVLGIILLLVLIPFLTLIVSSFTDEFTLARNGYTLFPQKVSLEAYRYIWNSRETIFRAYGNTVFVTFVGTAINVFMTMLLAYPLSLKNIPGRRIISFLVLLPMLFSGGLVPTYLIYTKYFGIRNTIFALIVPGLLFNPMNCIIMRTYLQSNIPSDLYEAAKIDGANEFAIFCQMVLPLGKPIMVAVSVFVGIAYWNNWTNGIYYVTDGNLFSIQQLLHVMNSKINYLNEASVSAAVTNVPSTGVRMAIAVVAMLPMLIIFPFIQKYFQEGISLGAVKG